MIIMALNFEIVLLVKSLFHILLQSFILFNIAHYFSGGLHTLQGITEAPLLPHNSLTVGNSRSFPDFD